MHNLRKEFLMSLCSNLSGITATLTISRGSSMSSPRLSQKPVDRNWEGRALAVIFRTLAWSRNHIPEWVDNIIPVVCYSILFWGGGIRSPSVRAYDRGFVAEKDDPEWNLCHAHETTTSTWNVFTIDGLASEWVGIKVKFLYQSQRSRSQQEPTHVNISLGG